MDRKYKAFISYRHADLDSAVAKTLHSLIEQYRVPKALRLNGEKKMGIVFRDEEELSATNDLTDKIYTALDNSEHLVVICTKSTLQSPWVTKEVEHFLKKHDRDKAHIILADGEPMEVFPRPLTHTELENGMIEVTEPMAVDVRAESIPAVKKKLKTQVLRLFAAMLGCPYDALAMREQHRKRQRFAAIMSVILAIAVGFSAILLVKNHEIDQKNAELDSANTALEAKNEELDKKNEELERKNSEVLLRESELLTANSQEAYMEGDNYSAIYNAAYALPTESDPRPYYAPAEAALLAALGPFSQDDRYIIDRTVLEQSTPVENFRISADGTRLATIDKYSVITVFDTVTGEVLGSVQLSHDTVYYSTAYVHMYSYAEENSVIVFDGNTIAAVSFDTCEIIWSRKVGNTATDFFMLTSDGKSVAYVNIVNNDENYLLVYELVLLSGSTGEILKTLPFAKSNDYGGILFYGSLADGTYNGRFSSDDSLFVTSYFSDGSEDEKTLHYVVIDLNEGTSRELCSFPVDTYYFYEKTYLIYFNDDKTITSVRGNGNSGYALTLERISVETGKVIWQTAVPKNKKAAYTTTKERFFGFYTNTAEFIILNDNLYVLDSATGEFIASSHLDGIVAEAAIVNGTVVYAFENGHYSASSLNENGITDLGDSLSLGSIYRMRLWNNGPEVLHNGEREIEESGYIAVTPADNLSSVIINRVDVIGDLFPGEFSAVNDGESYLASAYIQPLKNGNLAIGPYSRDDQYFFKIYDTSTRELVCEISTSNYLFSNSSIVLDDGSGFIENDSFGSLTYYKSNGESTVLADAGYAVYSYGDNTYLDVTSLFESVILSETRDVLSAQCSADTLTTWINGEGEKSIPLPEDINCVKVGPDGVVFFLTAGSDGSIVIPDFDDDDLYADRFAVYNVMSAKWHYIENENIVFLDGVVCFSDETSDLLILDDNSNYYRYSSSGELLDSFRLNLPSNSVFQMSLILDNDYLLVKTSDLQVNIYNSHTGELIYTENNVSLSQVPVSAHLDKVNNRLYISSTSSASTTEGLCIDLGSWTTIAKVSGLIYFDEST